jgi:hypothetical protein
MALKGSYLQLGGYYASSSDYTAQRLLDAGEHAIHGYFRNDATSGDNRALYLRMDFKGGGGGDCARFFSLVKAATATVQGVHATAQIDTGGSITGLLCGMRATFGALTGLTISGGTACALQVDSDLASAVTGMTKSSFIRIADNGASKLGHLFEFTQTATTDGSTMYWYNASGETFTCKGGLKIMTADGALYIPIGTVT